MSSVKYHRGKAKKLFLIDKIAFFLLYLASIGFFYMIWNSYISQKLSAFAMYLGLYVFFIVAVFLVIRDIHKEFEGFERVKDEQGKQIIKKAHLLCGNPLCPRCGGWYVGLSISTSVVLAFKDNIIYVLADFGFSPFLVIGLGVVLFVITTPIHGALTFLKIVKHNVFEKKRTKFVLGLFSGLSVSIIVIGGIMFF